MRFQYHAGERMRSCALYPLARIAPVQSSGSREYRNSDEARDNSVGTRAALIEHLQCVTARADSARDDSESAWHVVECHTACVDEAESRAQLAERHACETEGMITIQQQRISELEKKLHEAEIENIKLAATLQSTGIGSERLTKRVCELEAALRAAEIESGVVIARYARLKGKMQELEAKLRTTETDCGGAIGRNMALQEQMHTLTAQLHVAGVDEDLQDFGANWALADIQSVADVDNDLQEFGANWALADIQSVADVDKDLPEFGANWHPADIHSVGIHSVADVDDDLQEFGANWHPADVQGVADVDKDLQDFGEKWRLADIQRKADVDKDLQEFGDNWHLADIRGESPHSQESQMWWLPMQVSEEPTLQGFSVS